MRRWLFSVALIAALLLIGCQTTAPDVTYNGTPLSEEEILAMATGFETEATSEPEPEAPEETREPQDGIVHWTAGGEVWHEWNTCSHLSRRDEIVTGTVEEAEREGKLRGCAFCTRETKQNEDK